MTETSPGRDPFACIPDESALYAGTVLETSAEREARETRQTRTCTCDCGCSAPGHPDDDGTPGRCDPCRMNIHRETL